MTSKRDSKKKKRSRVQQNVSPLVSSGLPIFPQSWHDHLPELLYIIGALERSTVGCVVDLLQRLKNLIPEFTGRVSELGRYVGTEPSHVKNIEGELKELFVGANAALLRRFSVPGHAILRSQIHLPDASEEEDYFDVASLVAKANETTSPRTTRAKLVQLLLILLGLKGIHTLSVDQLAPVLSAEGDDVPADNSSQIRATWLALQVNREQFEEWPRFFWEEGLSQTPCIKPPNPESPDRVRLDGELSQLVTEMDRVWRELVELELKYPIQAVGEVIFGLTCRVWRLTHDIIDLSGLGKGETAEITVRCLFESAVTLLWLLKKQDASLFQRFKDYSAGKDKTQLEYVRRMKEGTPELRKTMEHLLAQDIRQAGMSELLLSEEKGSWIDVSVRDMAESMDPLYMGVFARTSDIVHGSWRALTRYHLVRCINPLHAFHYMPYTGPSHDAGLSPIICALLLAADALVSVTQEVGATQLNEDAKGLAVAVRKVVVSRSPQKGLIGHSIQGAQGEGWRGGREIGGFRREIGTVGGLSGRKGGFRAAGAAIRRLSRSPGRATKS